MWRKKHQNTLKTHPYQTVFSIHEKHFNLTELNTQTKPKCKLVSIFHNCRPNYLSVTQNDRRIPISYKNFLMLTSFCSTKWQSIVLQKNISNIFWYFTLLLATLISSRIYVWMCLFLDYIWLVFLEYLTLVLKIATYIFGTNRYIN